MDLNRQTMIDRQTRECLGKIIEVDEKAARIKVTLSEQLRQIMMLYSMLGDVEEKAGRLRSEVIGYHKISCCLRENNVNSI